MNMNSSLAILRAGARLIPSDLHRKNSPTLEQMILAHAEKVKEMAEGFKNADAGFETQLQEMRAEITEISQRMAQGRGLGGSLFKEVQDTLGKQFLSEKSGDLAKMGRNDRVSMEFKATITSATSNAPGSAGDLVVPEREQILGMPKRRLTIRSLLKVKPTSHGSIERPRQVMRSTAAASVPEGLLKPEGDFQFTMETVPTRVIAHWVKASRQILSDEPQLEDLIDTELRYGLALEEERQLLKGDGTGQNLKGMNVAAAAYVAQAAILDDNPIDKIGSAILQVALTDNVPDGIVLHPVDWWRIILLKDAAGGYIITDPTKASPRPSLFGLPVVVTPSQTIDKFTVGSFGQQTLYDRWQASVDAAFVNDDFVKNLVTILAEERVGFIPDRPDALVYGDFGFVAS